MSSYSPTKIIISMRELWESSYHTASVGCGMDFPTKTRAN